MFDKGTITGRVDTGSIDTVSAVDMDDNVWKEESSGTVAVVSIDIDDCEKPLEVQLDIGKDCTPEHWTESSHNWVDKKKHNVFALFDKELGGTDLVEHFEMSDTIKQYGSTV